MSTTPFMPLWVSDFLGDTLELDATEVGAYMLLIMAQWQRGGRSLPADEKKLQLIARCGRNWPKVWANIERFFERDEDGFFSEKGRDVFKNVAAKREVNSQNGVRGGIAKSLKNKDRHVANAIANDCRKPAISKPYSEREEKREANASPKKARGERLSDDWVLPAEWAEWALSQGLSVARVEAEAERFLDYWLARAGPGGVKLDWAAAWRNWIRNSRDGENGARNSPQRSNGPVPRGAAGIVAGFAAAARQGLGGAQPDGGGIGGG